MWSKLRPVGVARRAALPWRRRVGPEAGSATAEIVLWAVVLVLLVLLPIQAALWMHARHLAAAAAEVGAHAAATTSVGAEASGRSASEAMLSGSAASLETLTVARSETTATVTVSLSMRSLLPGVAMHITETSQRPVDRFVGDPNA